MFFGSKKMWRHLKLENEVGKPAIIILILFGSKKWRHLKLENEERKLAIIILILFGSKKMWRHQKLEN